MVSVTGTDEIDQLSSNLECFET